MAKIKIARGRTTTTQYICDRCDAELPKNYKESRIPAISVSVRGSGGQRQWKDLCKKCLDEIVDLLDTRVFSEKRSDSNEEPKKRFKLPLLRQT